MGRQLAQVRPAVTTNVTLFSPSAGERYDVQLLYICNLTAGALTFRVFYDDDGNTFDNDSAIFYDMQLPANTTYEIDFAKYGIKTIESTATFGIQSNSANNINFILFGEKITG